MKRKDEVGKNSATNGRRRPVTLRDMNAEFRGIRSQDELEDILDEWDDEEIAMDAPKEAYRFIQD